MHDDSRRLVLLVVVCVVQHRNLGASRFGTIICDAADEASADSLTNGSRYSYFVT